MSEGSKEHDWKSCVRHNRTEGSNPSLSAIDTRRQGSTYAVFLFVKKPCFIAFLTGFLSFLSDILTFGCSSTLHYVLRDLYLMPFLTFGFPTYCSVGVNLDCPANSSFNQDFNSSFSLLLGCPP